MIEDKPRSKTRSVIMLIIHGSLDSLDDKISCLTPLRAVKWNLGINSMG